MNGTGLDHPLVRGYLRELDAAFAALPGGQARELREQITAHLEDALRPGADDREVAGVLGRLGPPADLAAEAAPGTAPATGPPRERRHLRPPRLRRRGWALLAVAVVLAGAVTSYAAAVATAAPLRSAGASSWWYAQDSARAVDTSADGAGQTTVPIRSGQRQGFVITVYNPGRWTQTVLGTAGGFVGPGGPGVQISVGTSRNIDRGGGDFLAASYAAPGSIPPHQTRALRVLWRSTTCLAPGAGQGTDALPLRVRIGWRTRTVVVQLDQGWWLSGPSRGRCI